MPCGMQLLWTTRVATSRSAFVGLGRTFPGTTAEERKVQTVEQNNMAANVKVAGDDGGVETMETQEAMDGIEEVPHSTCCRNCPKRGIP